MTADFLHNARTLLNKELFHIAKTPITVSTLLSVLAVVVATFWVSRALRRAVERVLTWKGERPANIGTVTSLLHYSVLVTGFGVALSTAGIDLTALFAAGAIFAVGLGFAMQSIAQNFVAGIILLAERSIKPGDLLEVEGKLVKVLEMGIRSSIAQTRDGEDLIIPNATLIQTTVKNFTLKDACHRVRATVGVAYGSDMAAVKETLTTVAHEVSKNWAVKDREPQVILLDFGNSSVVWEVAIWMTDPWLSRAAMSELREAIWRALQANKIVIAFPQLDIHLDDQVVSALGRQSGSGSARAAEC
ncbi:MAG: mechanosensitive ion channel [Myxococcales bacterium]|nr:mechanosensitive ion channel [Myxococcales bacterium]